MFTLGKLLFSHNQLQCLKVKCTHGYGTKKIAQVPREGSFSTCTGKRIGCVTFPTICSNIPTKTTILPLRYHCNIKPDNTEKCDLPGCNISNPNESWSILIGCFQSIHCKCLDESTSCPLCKDFLQKKVQELGEIAKEATLHPHATDTDDHNESTTASMTDSTVDEENHRCERNGDGRT